MGIRTALGQSKIVTFAILIALAWTIISLVSTLGNMEGLFVEAEAPVVSNTGSYVGEVAVSGIVGALVLLALAGLLVYLYAETTELDPAPEPWPED